MVEVVEVRPAGARDVRGTAEDGARQGARVRKDQRGEDEHEDGGGREDARTPARREGCENRGRERQRRQEERLEPSERDEREGDGLSFED